MNNFKYLIFWVYSILMLNGAMSNLIAQSDCRDGEWLIDGSCTSSNMTLSNDWHTVEPGGDTQCAHETDYRFWVRPGNDDVLLYFQGGGGCWNQDTCRSGSTFYKQHVGPNEATTYARGVFEFDNPDNPFSDHTIVFAPSCTGDVYMSSGEVDYGDEVVVHHRGFDNLMSAIDFTIDYAPDAESVFVAGCSAGSVGSAMAIPFIIEAYPDVRVTQLGDSLGTIFDTPTDLTTLWDVPDFYTDPLAEVAPDLSNFTMAEYYRALGEAYPDHSFAQFNYQMDSVQQRFFAAGVSNPAEFISDALVTSLTTIAEAIPNFRYYLADGASHCILPTARFYQTEVDGISALDWIKAIYENEPIEDVSIR